MCPEAVRPFQRVMWPVPRPRTEKQALDLCSSVKCWHLRNSTVKWQHPAEPSTQGLCIGFRASCLQVNVSLQGSQSSSNYATFYSAGEDAGDSYHRAVSLSSGGRGKALILLYFVPWYCRNKLLQTGRRKKP